MNDAHRYLLEFLRQATILDSRERLLREAMGREAAILTIVSAEEGDYAGPSAKTSFCLPVVTPRHRRHKK